MFPILTLLIAMFSIQSGASIAKRLFPELGVEGTTALRILFAAIIMVVIWRPWKVKLSRAQLKNVLGYGIALGVMNLTFYYALARIPLGVAVALEFTGPLAVAVFASRKKIDFLWVVLAALGIGLILPFDEVSGPLDLLGVFFALVAGACWGLYIIFGQRISSVLHGGVASSYGMSIAALVVLPFGLFTAGSKMFAPDILPMALGIALLSSAIPYSLEMIALKALKPHTFGILMSLEPAVAALSGFVFLSEKLSIQQMSAIICIIIASTGTAWTSRPKPVVKDQPI